MRLSNVLLRILWKRPEDESSAENFIAETTDGYVIPRFLGGFEVVGNNQANTKVTMFIRPDSQFHMAFGGTIIGLFDAVKNSGAVDMVGDDEIRAWVYVEGEVVMRGRAAIEQFAVVRDGDFLYSDVPHNVLILDWLRFLSPKEQAELETHMGQF